MASVSLGTDEEGVEEELEDSQVTLSYSSNDSPTDVSLIQTMSTDEEQVKVEVIPVTPNPRELYCNSTTTIDTIVGGVIGPKRLMDAVSCPCCQQPLDETHAQTLNEPARIARSRGSLLAIESEEEDEDEEERAYDEDMLPGSLGEGVQYHTRHVLVEGWVHKKGTGKDWLGSRSWKARWARLITARVDGYETDVPLLQIFWHPSAPLPSTVIMLASTVVLAVDLEDKERWNSFRFEIRHATTRENTTIPVTRTFTAPRKSRDAWVFAISEALLAYEKQKDSAKKAAVWEAIDTDGCIKSPKRSGSPKSPRFDEVWTGDRFVTVEVRKALSPPSSPPQPDRMHTMSFPSPPASPRLPRPGGRALRRPVPQNSSG